MNDYKVFFSGRKTIAIYIRPDGSVEVRAPRGAGAPLIRDFVKSKQTWIQNTRENMEKRQKERRVISLSRQQVVEVKKQAKQLLSVKCAHYAKMMGVDYHDVKVNSAKTRWGSCTSAGCINFTYRLIFAEDDLIDYVVVHELAHRREMNHSFRFWEVVEQTMPDYAQRRSKLKEFQRKVTVEEQGDGCEK